jgi:hypothetical protein
VTWHLAASSSVRLVAVSAGRHLASGVHLTARDAGALVLLGLVAAVVYLGACCIWPYGPCFACRAHPRRNPGSDSRRHGRCRICRGSGERLRVGTRLLLAATDGRVPKGVRR